MSSGNNLYSKTFEIIFTVKTGSLGAGINELLYIDPKANIKKWLGEGIALMQLSESFLFLVEEFKIKKPIFLQHVFPVNFSCEVDSLDEGIEVLKKQVILLENNLNVEKSFSVQCRFIGDVKKNYKKFEINEIISNLLQIDGFRLNIKKPEKVVSIVFSENSMFMGISDAKDNLSDWAGGRHRFAREEEQISRAEFKLLEAIDHFELEFPPNGVALDLGASPGGWTRVLLANRLKVIAVDPAELNNRLLKDHKVIHYKEIAQKFFRRKLDYKFDVIVNDMKIDTNESALLIVESRKVLKRDGIVVMTLKLPKKNIQNRVKQSFKILESCYEVVGARQLFHNRSEVTLVLKLKS